MPKPIPSEKDRVYDEILSEIIAGSYAKGEELPEKILIDRHSTTRAPLRDAMVRLAAEGLLVRGSSGSLRVAVFRQHEIESIVALRLTLECSIALALNEHDNRKLCQDLEDINGTMLQLADGPFDKKKRIEFFLGDIRFHTLMCRAAGLESAIPILTRCYYATILFLGTQIKKSEATMICDAHGRIIRELRTPGRWEAVARVLQSHIIRATRNWYPGLRSYQQTELPRLFALLARMSSQNVSRQAVRQSKSQLVTSKRKRS